MFANYHDLSRDNLLAWAKQIGLDVNKFKADLDSGKYDKIVKKDLADGEAAGVYGTPAFFINGKLYNGSDEAGCAQTDPGYRAKEQRESACR